MTSTAATEQGSGVRSTAWFVLVGGEAYVNFGREYLQREWAHASLSWVGMAYDELRKRGVPRDRIITIAQVNDYFSGLQRAKAPEVLINNYKKAVSRLLEEGGADYDAERVNPTTLLNVLLGKEVLGTKEGTEEVYQKVVPHGSASPIFLAIYSHGDSHPIKADPKKEVASVAESAAVAATASELKRNSSFQEVDWKKHEWYIHFPFPGHKSSILPSVCTEAVPKTYNHRCHLYAQHMIQTFAELFKRFPRRPIVTLLNACRSGGFLEAVNRPAARKMYGSDAWPLFFMASARPEDDALVGGMWKEVFELLPSVSDFSEERIAKLRESISSSGEGKRQPGVLNSKGVPQRGFYIEKGNDTLQQFFMRCRMGYYQNNIYELVDRTSSYCFPSNVSPLFRKRIKPLLTAGEGGLPDFEEIKALQDQYKSRGIEMWDPRDWGRHKVVSLPGAVKRAARFRATPQLVFGLKSGVCDLDLVRLLFSGENWCENTGALAKLQGAQASALAPAKSRGTSQGKSTNEKTKKKTTKGEANEKKREI